MLFDKLISKISPQNQEKDQPSVQPYMEDLSLLTNTSLGDILLLGRNSRDIRSTPLTSLEVQKLHPNTKIGETDLEFLFTAA